VRSVVRDSKSGQLGTFSKYLEIPDLSKGKLSTSSLFLFAVNQSGPPVPLLALRQLTRKEDLRYAVSIYNAKTKDGKPQVRSQMIISQGGKVLFSEPEQAIEGGGTQVTKMGQLGLAKVPPGRYVLTVVISDPNDNKTKIARSLDFTVVN
jgi:hypothetical protein